MRLADHEMQTQGIVAVGDISNTNETIKTKLESDLYYHTLLNTIVLQQKVRALAIFCFLTTFQFIEPLKRQ
jgi:hypothetical protein